jgi:hypothetical protein
MALAEQIDVVIGQLGREAVGVVVEVSIAPLVGPYQAVAVGDGALAPAPLKQVRPLDALHGLIDVYDHHFPGARQVGAHHLAAAVLVFTQYGKRVMVLGMKDPLQFGIHHLGRHAQSISFHAQFLPYSSIKYGQFMMVTARWVFKQF